MKTQKQDKILLYASGSVFAFGVISLSIAYLIHSSNLGAIGLPCAFIGGLLFLGLGLT